MIKSVDFFNNNLSSKTKIFDTESIEYVRVLFSQSEQIDEIPFKVFRSCGGAIVFSDNTSVKAKFCFDSQKKYMLVMYPIDSFSDMKLYNMIIKDPVPKSMKDVLDYLTQRN
jgi:hypothetical protein